MTSERKGASQPLEATLWEAADRLRNKMDAAEYKHVVLGLIFLKYVSDVFEARRRVLEALVDDPSSDYFMPTPEAKAAILESRDEYASEGVFWVPEGARWDDLRKAAKLDDVPIGKRLDDAMDAIENLGQSPQVVVLRGQVGVRHRGPRGGDTSGAAGLIAFDDVDPAVQTGFGDPEALGDLRNRLITLAGNSGHVVAELLRIGRGHDADPSREDVVLIGQESTEAWAVSIARPAR